ncbi:MAG: tetratricopeptide repeat protein [Microcystis sp. M54BS1]|uniref:tetratricopeptide repeat protein n=1 Tax=unclassified Microcystis TaxID=2643300 RepID=UPI00257D9199|nr:MULTISPECIES: tetratricopeptide repeat protein [unclassified Microcystis]MCA2537851.1 tetratricopeptide repeat protein [Microcystis sp. M54BS1]MCA2596657.1 tetratricopeptide repeat protein [Microcystis sp. M38BS1]MCA2608452.1 tetratricopeptide repeat protein [Microcystis sp. M27BS1]MCA2507616.1 tetratricopeptide repeat protein [Microcystis sp. M62BS1]MCA2510791.1 tetratricopeptide repeat protein [Microcystis sp. M60BS1]
MNDETSSIIDQNEREYEGLIVSLEANQERLNILICVCDQEKLREEIIDRYSKELEPVIPCYRIDLDQKEPSLRAAIASLVSRKPELLQSKNAVITTTGVEKLHSISRSERVATEWQREKSELDKFFGYLQWTREGLREFPYSIVLWVTSTVEVNLRKKSPDFWSWRKGVFRFISPPSNFLPSQEFLPILQSFDEITIDKDIPLISKEDLLELIEQIEVNKGKKEPRLASLYASLAKIYNHRLLNLPLVDYRQELLLAIEYYQKAIDLQKELNLELDLVASLDSLASIYYSLGEYQKAIEFYQQSLAITRKIDDRGGEASSYNNLGSVYYSLGEYQKASEFHQQSLAIKREISDITGEAYSYLGLGNVYGSLGEYQKASEFYQKSLEIFQEMEYIIGEPKTLFNLGLTYYKLDRISEAKEAYLQARKLFQALGLAGYVQYCDQAIRQL